MLDKKRTYSFSLNQCKRQDGQLVAELNVPTCHVTIISPSFGCPGVFEENKDITLFVLADKEFYDLSQKDPKSLAENVINYHLKITLASSVKECIDDFMYAKGNAATNIKCTYLDDLRPKRSTDFDGQTTVTPAETRIRNKDGKLVACIRESTRDYYLSGADKADKAKADADGVIRIARPYLFQIDLKPDTMQSPLVTDNFYDCSWFVANVKPNVPAKDKICELQDLDCRQFVKDKSKVLRPESLFKVNNGEVKFEHDEASPIQAMHPFIISNKPHLNIGQLSDVHISSRQISFKKSTVRVLEGMSDSPAIGELVNTTLESFSDMLKQMADDSTIDAIIITGDLIDYNHNFLPTTEINSPGDLWDKMHHDKHHDEKLYPRFLDSLVIFSLLKSYYDKPDWKKPIFLISGNHEHYSDIYAISPRVKGLALDSQKDNKGSGWKRANEGVPADHNLTIYEACLMYGPDYAYWSKNPNFEKQYADWFYRILTPLTDYRFTFQKQSFVALGWGDNEDLLSNLSATHWVPDTTLYRASESVSDVQLELAQAGAKAGSQRMIFTHYPFASYDIKLGLQEKGDMDCSDNFVTKSFDEYSQGSFKKNRVKMHEMLSRKDFDYTFSGHSHRAGLYQGDFKNGMTSATYSIQGTEIPQEPAAPLTLPVRGKCNMIVCGCSGPIGIQNHYERFDEKGAFNKVGLGPYGLDYPSGNHVILNPAAMQIKRVIPKNTKSAKPRFAVALDYMDILGREVGFANMGSIVGMSNPGVFASIVSDATGACFTFTVNPKLPATRFIKDIALVAYLDDSPKVGKVYMMDQVNEKGARVLEAKLAKGNERVVATKLTPKKGKEIQIKTFLKITFNTTLQGITGFKQYNFDTPWIFPIEIVDRKAEMRKMLEAGGRGNLSAREIEQQVSMVSGYVLQRHQKCGEIPNHEWYSTTFGYGYDFNNNPKKKK